MIAHYKQPKYLALNTYVLMKKFQMGNFNRSKLKNNFKTKTSYQKYNRYIIIPQNQNQIKFISGYSKYLKAFNFDLFHNFVKNILFKIQIILITL